MIQIKNNKKLLFLIVILIVLVASGLFIWNNRRDSRVDTTSSDTSTTGDGVAQEQSGAAIKSPDSKETNQPAEPPTTTSTIPNAALTIDNFSQSGGLVKASANVTTSNVGSCYFNFSSEGTKPVARSTQSIQQNGTQKCSIEINEVEFTKLGTWKLVVIFTQNNSKLESSKDVTIN